MNIYSIHVWHLTTHPLNPAFFTRYLQPYYEILHQSNKVALTESVDNGLSSPKAKLQDLVLRVTQQVWGEKRKKKCPYYDCWENS